MIDLGDRVNDSIINFKFPTQQADGTPITLAGGPAISVYKDDSNDEIAAGITLTVDKDGRTGMNHVKIDLSADVGYTVASDYDVIITTGTVDSVSVVGKSVGYFSIENRFMRGTNNANTAVPDVAGTAAALHVTTDALITAIGVIVTAIQVQTDKMTFTGANIHSDAKAMADNVIAAAKIASNALTDAKFASGSFAKVFTSAIVEAYSVKGAAPTLAQFMCEMISEIREFVISGTVKTNKKLNGSATAYLNALNDATNPTGVARDS